MVVYISIGNSDDGLSQARWALFQAVTDQEIRKAADQVHGAWVSHATAQWQNTCWAADFEPGRLQSLRNSLAILCRQFDQESIAWAVAPVTEFIGPSA